MDRLLSIARAGKAAASINANRHDSSIILLPVRAPGIADSRNRKCMSKSLPYSKSNRIQELILMVLSMAR